MTREEAIGVLLSISAGYCCFDYQERLFYHAISMAIEALKAQNIGKWEKIKVFENGDVLQSIDGKMFCDQCGTSAFKTNYCPTCGAWMRDE